jgi:hypothetical protein
MAMLESVLKLGDSLQRPSANRRLQQPRHLFKITSTLTFAHSPAAAGEEIFPLQGSCVHFGPQCPFTRDFKEILDVRADALSVDTVDVHADPACHTL